MMFVKGSGEYRGCEVEAQSSRYGSGSGQKVAAEVHAKW